MFSLLVLLVGNVLVMALLIVVTRTLLLWRNNISIIAFMLAVAQLSGICLALFYH